MREGIQCFGRMEGLLGPDRLSEVKTQGSLPSAQAAEFLLFGLIISGQIHMRKIDGWRELKQVSLLKAA